MSKKYININITQISQGTVTFYQLQEHFDYINITQISQGTVTSYNNFFSDKDINITQISQGTVTSNLLYTIPTFLAII